MKKKIVLLVLVTTLLGASLRGCLTTRQAAVIGGMAAGAGIGQAVGRDTPSTLGGAAIGGLLGLLLGEALEQGQWQRR